MILLKTNRRLLLVCIYCIFHFIATAQNNTPYSPKFYNLPKEIIFQENFDDSTDRWSKNVTGEDTVFFDKKALAITSDNISDGCLKFINRDSVGIWAAPHFLQMDYSQNFEVEINAKIQYTANKKKWSIVLFLGRDKSLRAQFFYISKSKNIDLIYTEDSSHWDKPIVKHWTAFNFDKDNFNKITFRKVNKSYYLFINEKFIKKFDYNPISGHII